MNSGSLINRNLDKEWELFNFSESNWFELRQRDRDSIRGIYFSKLIRELVAKETSAVAKRRVALFVALMGVKYGDIEKALDTIRSGQANVACEVEGVNGFEKLDLGNYDFSLLVEADARNFFTRGEKWIIDTMIRTYTSKVPYTPFNYDVIKSDPRVTKVFANDQLSCYRFGNREITVAAGYMPDVFPQYASILEKEKNTVDLDRDYHPYKYNHVMEIFAKMVTCKYNIEVDDFGLKLCGERTYTMPMLDKERFRLYTFEIMGKLEKRLGPEMRLRLCHRNSTNAYALVYAALWDSELDQDVDLMNSVRFICGIKDFTRVDFTKKYKLHKQRVDPVLTLEASLVTLKKLLEGIRVIDVTPPKPVVVKGEAIKQSEGYAIRVYARKLGRMISMLKNFGEVEFRSGNPDAMRAAFEDEIATFTDKSVSKWYAMVTKTMTTVESDGPGWEVNTMELIKRDDKLIQFSSYRSVICGMDDLSAKIRTAWDDRLDGYQRGFEMMYKIKELKFRDLVYLRSLCKKEKVGLELLGLDDGGYSGWHLKISGICVHHFGIYEDWVLRESIITGKSNLLVLKELFVEAGISEDEIVGVRELCGSKYALGDGSHINFLDLRLVVKYWKTKFGYGTGKISKYRRRKDEKESFVFKIP